MKYLSLFSGIGGFELGIQQAYKQIYFNKTWDKNRPPSPICVGYSEIDKYAIQIYNKHFNHKNYGDIKLVRAYDLPDFELLVGGFPCQSFSIAGKRGGFEDTRGTLFFEIARIVRRKQPRLLLLENVKGLLSHDKGATFFKIISTLDELGYDCQWQVLNSKNFGVPQNRERVFIVGHFRGTSRPKVFPFGSSSEESTREADKQRCSNTLTGRSAGGHNRRGNYIKISKKGHIKKDQENAATLTGGAHSGGKHSDMDLIQLNQPKHSNDRVYSEEGISPTLNTMQGGNRQPFISLQYKGLCDKLGIYDTKKKTNTIKTLSILQKKIGTEAFTQWGFGVLDSLQSEEVLQPILHGKGVRYKADKKTSEVDDGSLSRKEDMSQRGLRSLWQSKNGSTPHKSRLARQFVRELAKGLSELPQQDSSFRIRRLTPTEAERLQGFPDGWTEVGTNNPQKPRHVLKHTMKDGWGFDKEAWDNYENNENIEISDTQRYKTLGNAVTVNVIQAIMEKLI